MTTQPVIYDTYAEALTYIESFAPIDVGGEIGVDHLDTSDITDLAEFTQELTTTMTAVAVAHAPPKSRIQLQLAYYRDSSTSHPEVLGVLYRFIKQLPTNGPNPRSYSHDAQVNAYLRNTNWRFNKIAPSHLIKRTKYGLIGGEKAVGKNILAVLALELFNTPAPPIPNNIYSL